ncbi:MAG: CDGSH iron-sulfur domain-containing protein, partial [Flavobacteriales bacterium]|nr:CDGSH iron-sulfur domain-containing protein [Flavobacteriales bacterium]
GTCLVKHADGRTETREKVTAFCRCGSSSNKPYCDGTHRKVDFSG